MIGARLKDPREPPEHFVRWKRVESSEQLECLRIAHPMRRGTDLSKKDAAGPARTAELEYSLAANEHVVKPA
jgi:hypothetical protein